MSLSDSESPLLDLSNLKFQPAWVNESSDFSNYAGESAGADRRGRDERDRRGPRPPGQGRDRDRDRRDQGGPRRRDDARGPSRGAPASRGEGGPRRPRGDSGPGQRGPRDPRDSRRGGGPVRPPREEMPPAPVKVEFLPDEAVLAALATQIRSSHLTYPLFGLAKKFLEKPEYHQVRISIDAPPGAPEALLYRVGEGGAVTLDRRAAERVAFERNRARFYEEKTEQGEPPKGNFSNVARCRLDGTLLGPTNHHGYQTALRALYDARYSRRMSFEQFRREIEVVSEPAEVEKWKEQARASTTYTVMGSEPPVVLKSAAEVRQHFDEHHLNSILQSGPSFVLAGPAARSNPDPALARAMRAAWEMESRYPGNLVQHVRAGLQKASLQIFKHRKKFVHVSGVRPTAFKPGADSAVSTSIQAILAAIADKPGISRKALAEKIVGPATAPVAPQPEAAPASAPSPTESAVVEEQPAAVAGPVETPAPALALDDAHAKAKAAMVNDLHWLVTSGHVIAFFDGTYDLPPVPVAKPAPPAPLTKPETPKVETPAAASAEPDPAAATSAGSDAASTPHEEAKMETTILEGGIPTGGGIATPVTEAPLAH